jgi:hypothetical protein
MSGSTIREVLAEANLALGQGGSIYDIAELRMLLVSLNAAFSDGVVSSFAREHLSPTPCP